MSTVEAVPTLGDEWSQRSQAFDIVRVRPELLLGPRRLLTPSEQRDYDRVHRDVDERLANLFTAQLSFGQEWVVFRAFDAVPSRRRVYIVACRERGTPEYEYKDTDRKIVDFRESGVRVVWRSPKVDEGLLPLLARKMRVYLGQEEDEDMEELEADVFAEESARRLAAFASSKKTVGDAWRYLVTRPMFNRIMRDKDWGPRERLKKCLTQLALAWPVQTIDEAAAHMREHVFPWVFDDDQNPLLTEDDIRTNGNRPFLLTDALLRIASTQPIEYGNNKQWLSHIMANLTPEMQSMGFASGSDAIRFLHLHFPEAMPRRRVVQQTPRK